MRSFLTRDVPVSDRLIRYGIAFVATVCWILLAVMVANLFVLADIVAAIDLETTRWDVLRSVRLFPVLSALWVIFGLCLPPFWLGRPFGPASVRLIQVGCAYAAVVLSVAAPIVVAAGGGEGSVVDLLSSTGLSVIALIIVTCGAFLIMQRGKSGSREPSSDMRPLEIRELDGASASDLTAAFCVPGWNKPPDQYDRYLDQHGSGEILCLVGYSGERIAGYLKVVWAPGYPPFRDDGIPEIQDLNVLAEFRRNKVATRLLDRAESEVSRRSPVVGIGFGLHPGYNAAQRLYILRGYVPDGRGVTYKDRFVSEREILPFDDDLVLHLTKNL